MTNSDSDNAWETIINLYMNDNVTRRPLTEAEQIWKSNLRALYSRKKKELSLTQEKVAHMCGWKTQATVSNYMNGVIPLNTDAKLKLAKAMEADVREIDPDFDSNLMATPSLEAVVEKHQEWFDSLSREEQQDVMIELAKRVKSKTTQQD